VPVIAERIDVSGIQLVGAESKSIGPAPDAQLTEAWTALLHLAEGGNDLGYPWIDVTRHQVVAGVTNAAGYSAIDRWKSGGAAARNPRIGALPRPSVIVATRDVSVGFDTLEGVKNDATRLVQAGVPDADAIYQTEPDWEHDRVVLTISRPSPALMNALAVRYGTEMIAVRLEPRSITTPQSSRGADSSPFKGGAIISTGAHGCSSGFSWIDTYSTHYMLTAAHCAPTGSASVTTSVDTMGSITSATRENWTDNTGTVYFTGDSTYRGDVALIQMSGKTGDPKIYSAADTTTTTTVHSMWTTVPSNGESYCTSGSNTYAICGWVVDHSRINYLYANGEWVLNATKGLKTSGTSTNGGDSGGPVYTVDAQGTIAAKGIHSGGSYGPVGCYTGTPCVEIFTDILLPYYYFPGWLNTQ
jgi:hypothetical protein